MIVAVMGLLVVIALLTVATIFNRALRTRWSRHVGRWIVLAVATWGTLLIAEIALQAFGRSLWIEPPNVRPPNLRLVFHPSSAIMPGVSGDAHYSTNGDGLRGPAMPAPERARRIVCLGGSTTECTYLDDGETWPSLVAEKLNAAVPSDAQPHWVGAAAVSGASSREHLRFAETSRLLPAIDTLVVLCGINDLVLALSGDDKPLPRAPYIGSRLALPKLVVRSWSRWTAASRLATEDPQGRNYIARRAERAAAQRTGALPSLDQALAGYRERLAQIAQIARQHNVQLVFVEQPVLWRSDLPAESMKLLWLGRLADGRYATTDALRQAMDEFNASQREIALQTGAIFVEASSLAGRPELFYDDCHLNERGARELAGLVADAISK